MCVLIQSPRHSIHRTLTVNRRVILAANLHIGKHQVDRPLGTETFFFIAAYYTCCIL